MRGTWLAIVLAACGSGSHPGDDGGGGTCTTAPQGQYCCNGFLQSTPCFMGGTVISPDRITTWNPGILADTQLGIPLGADGLPQRTMVCATLSPGDDVQAAIDACPEGQVVQLAAGTFTVASTITLTRGVVVRGAGSQGAPSGTTITKTGGQSVLAIGTTQDQICYGGSATNLVADGAKEATSISVGAAAASFHAGDLALIDVIDD